ncbi:MAG: ubiquinol oxidase subunit II [Parachlamydiales bacterium]
MRHHGKIALFVILGLTAALIGLLCFLAYDAPVLNPAGWVGLQQRWLLIVGCLIMAVVVIPAFAIAFFVAWRYRAGNDKAPYKPEWEGNRWLELTWWAIPFGLMAVLGVINWASCHKLNPLKPLQVDGAPVAIQAVALQWKWLFLYPEQKIATVNTLLFPEKRPLNFEITAEAPMNSFWIPQLGGQIYAMPAMRTKLSLVADRQGKFRGSSANLSGVGFAGMHFVAEATSEEEFERWVKRAEQSANLLDLETYNQLAEPSENEPPTLYRLEDEGLFDAILRKYEPPVR